MPRATAKTSQKVTCYIAPDVVSMADSHIENACLENRSDIIEEALRYYCASLDLFLQFTLRVSFSPTSVTFLFLMENNKPQFYGRTKRIVKILNM